MIIKFLPAFNGDSILVSFKHQGENKNILIDGGIPRTYLHYLKPELERIAQKKENIDLLIITHIDDDHIGGIIELYQDKEFSKDFIKEIWFNSGEILSDYFEAEREPHRSVPLVDSDQTDMSVGQGVTLEKALKEHLGNWVQKIIRFSKEKINFWGLSITILSPNDNKLKKLHKHWEIETNTTVEMSAEHDDFNISISELTKLKFEEDSSIPNGSSIAFLIEDGKKSALLLADSHPSVIIESLTELTLATPDNKLEIDLIKISHHGSKRNTSPEFLSIIKCNKFVLLTDGSRHGLPDKQAIARIIASQPKCAIYFNYNEIPEKMFTEEDMVSYPFEYRLLSDSDYLIEL